MEHSKFQWDTASLLSYNSRLFWRHTWFIYQVFDPAKLIQTNIRIWNANFLNVAYCYVSSILCMMSKKKTRRELNNFRNIYRRKTHFYVFLHSRTVFRFLFLSEAYTATFLRLKIVFENFKDNNCFVR